jgi:hypothetical protein
LGNVRDAEDRLGRGSPMVGSCGRAMESEVAAAGGPVDPAILDFADVQQLEYLPTKLGKFFGILHVDPDPGDRGE